MAALGSNLRSAPRSLADLSGPGGATGCDAALAFVGAALVESGRGPRGLATAGSGGAIPGVVVGATGERLIPTGSGAAGAIGCVDAAGGSVALPCAGGALVVGVEIAVGTIGGDPTLAGVVALRCPPSVAIANVPPPAPTIASAAASASFHFGGVIGDDRTAPLEAPIVVVIGDAMTTGIPFDIGGAMGVRFAGTSWVRSTANACTALGARGIPAAIGPIEPCVASTGSGARSASGAIEGRAAAAAEAPAWLAAVCALDPAGTGSDGGAALTEPRSLTVAG